MMIRDTDLQATTIIPRVIASVFITNLLNQLYGQRN
jgi:hypothetical protein